MFGFRLKKRHQKESAAKKARRLKRGQKRAEAEKARQKAQRAKARSDREKMTRKAHLKNEKEKQQLLKKPLRKTAQVSDEILFDKNNPVLGRGKNQVHRVVVTAFDKKSKRIGVNTITSLKGKDGNPIKKREYSVKVNRIKPIPKSDVSNKSDLFGINLEVLTTNQKDQRDLNTSDIHTTNVKVSEKFIKKSRRFIYNNKEQPEKSRTNKERTRGMKK